MIAGPVSAIRSRMHLVRYTVFTAMAIALNLLFQNAILWLLGKVWFAIYAAMAIGNGVGLVFKFICDKYWVFADRDGSVRGTSKKFAIYTAFGLLTTGIFWGTELAFHYVFDTIFWTNVGAFVGLCIGYVIKYNLDKQITFSEARNAGN